MPTPDDSDAPRISTRITKLKAPESARAEASADQVALLAIIHIARDPARYDGFLSSGVLEPQHRPDAHDPTTRLAALDYLCRDTRRLLGFVQACGVSRQHVHASLRTMRTRQPGVYSLSMPSAALRRCA